MTHRISRREALRELGALFAIPFIRWPDRLTDSLAGTIVDYQAGRARGDWSAAQVTKEALDRSQAWNGTLHAIDLWSETALDEARDSDVRARRGRLRERRRADRPDVGRSGLQPVIHLDVAPRV